MNCGRSSSVEWKLPKLQRRVRFPSPAPPPPGCAPGGFVMPPRQARLACRTHFGRPNRYKTLPTHAPGRRYRYKTLPARAKTPIVAHFQHAGRTLYRFHHQQVEQGELCTAFTTHTTSRENFVPHAGPMPVQNSPRSRQNAHCGPFSACRENFIPLLPPTGRAGRTLYRTRGRCRYKTLPARSPAGDTGTKLSLHPQNGPFQHVLRQQGELYTAFTTHTTSREKKVPHQHSTSPTNAPLPQFRMQFDCLNVQPYPETLQSQRYEFKI